MKRKLLVIFFIATIISIIIYKTVNIEEKNVLFIGEKNYSNYSNNKEINKFIYDNITYKELVGRIKNNDYIVFKNKKIYLNQLIKNADEIIIGANNIEYNKICNNKEINKDYLDKKINNSKNELIFLLKRITSAKIKILNNTCK